MPTLHWLTRDEDIQTAARTPYRILQEEPTLSSGDLTAPNMLIEGDNLDALKSLLPFYAGKVKCIFIDPPYNTRSAFEHYDDNLEHTQWLAMIWPRLFLLREFLSEDGSLWITIDDNESHYLKIILDEIFGRQNFTANIVWQKSHTRENRTDISTTHDHLILFSKNRSGWKEIRNLLPPSDSQLERYQNPDKDPRGSWASLPAHAKAEKGRRSDQFFTVTTPAGRKIDPPAGRCWLYTKPRFDELVADGRIWFGQAGDNAPRVKKFLSEVQSGLVPTSIWMHGEVGTNGESKGEITTLFPTAVPFSTPKPERLIQRILHIATNPGDLVLDSFLGSGTTAAVAHKMNRKYIGIEIGGGNALNFCVPRLRKVIAGEQGGISQSVNWQGGGGFRFYRLGEPVFDGTGQIAKGIAFPTLAAHIWFSETATPLPAQPAPSPFLGVHNNRAYALLYNGILGDRRPAGGNVLTRAVLGLLREAQAAANAESLPMTIYGEQSRLAPATLASENIVFRQTPYDVKARR